LRSPESKIAKWKERSGPYSSRKEAARALIIRASELAPDRDFGRHLPELETGRIPGALNGLWQITSTEHLSLSLFLSLSLSLSSLSLSLSLSVSLSLSLCRSLVLQSTIRYAIDPNFLKVMLPRRKRLHLPSDEFAVRTLANSNWH
jgi:hypothetical protein